MMQTLLFSEEDIEKAATDGELQGPEAFRA